MHDDKCNKTDRVPGELINLFNELIADMRIARLHEQEVEDAPPPTLDGFLLQKFPDIYYKMVAREEPGPPLTDEDFGEEHEDMLSLDGEDLNGSPSTVAADSLSGFITNVETNFIWDKMYWGSGPLKANQEDAQNIDLEEEIKDREQKMPHYLPTRGCTVTSLPDRLRRISTVSGTSSTGSGGPSSRIGSAAGSAMRARHHRLFRSVTSKEGAVARPTNSMPLTSNSINAWNALSASRASLDAGISRSGVASQEGGLSEYMKTMLSSSRTVRGGVAQRRPPSTSIMNFLPSIRSGSTSRVSITGGGGNAGGASFAPSGRAYSCASSTSLSTITSVTADEDLESRVGESRGYRTFISTLPAIASTEGSTTSLISNASAAWSDASGVVEDKRPHLAEVIMHKENGSPLEESEGHTQITGAVAIAEISEAAANEGTTHIETCDAVGMEQKKETVADMETYPLTCEGSVSEKGQPASRLDSTTTTTTTATPTTATTTAVVVAEVAEKDCDQTGSNLFETSFTGIVNVNGIATQDSAPSMPPPESTGCSELSSSTPHNNGALNNVGLTMDSTPFVEESYVDSLTFNACNRNNDSDQKTFSEDLELKEKTSDGVGTSDVITILGDESFGQHCSINALDSREYTKPPVSLSVPSNVQVIIEESPAGGPKPLPSMDKCLATHPSSSAASTINAQSPRSSPSPSYSASVGSLVHPSTPNGMSVPGGSGLPPPPSYTSISRGSSPFSGLALNSRSGTPSTTGATAGSYSAAPLSVSPHHSSSLPSSPRLPVRSMPSFSNSPPPCMDNVTLRFSRVTSNESQGSRSPLASPSTSPRVARRALSLNSQPSGLSQQESTRAGAAMRTSSLQTQEQCSSPYQHAVDEDMEFDTTVIAQAEGEVKRVDYV